VATQLMASRVVFSSIQLVSYILSKSRCSPVGIATSYGLGRPAIINVYKILAEKPERKVIL
jgi:hypothetical protein